MATTSVSVVWRSVVWRLLCVLPLATPLGFAATRTRAQPARMGIFDQLASGLMQLGGQRLRVSHVMLRTDDEALDYRTRGECYELLSAWKERIDDDLEKFQICVSERSECASRDSGGDLGFVNPLTRGKLTAAFNDVIANEEPGHVYGPIETERGLHLVYLHAE
jgi:hypothetical protein